MTEKSYGGDSGVKNQGKPIRLNDNSAKLNTKPKSSKPKVITSDNKNTELEDYQKAGEISIKVKEYAKSIIKPDMLLLEIAQKIEKKIYELGGKPAFPVNLSINEVAAHYHPTLEDETKANGLLKIDLGVHVNGFIADTAFSMDLTPDNKFKELIKASEQALDSALMILPSNPSLSEIGKAIQDEIEKKGFSPIVNLSGHSLGKHEIHAGITIPNYKNNNSGKLDFGGYAIEPFATTGEGKIFEGQGGNIFVLQNPKAPRSPIARQILEYLMEEKQTLPFSLREIQEKFGKMARLGIRELEQNNSVYHFPQLIEKSKHPVSQAEHTFVKTKDGKIVITTK